MYYGNTIILQFLGLLKRGDLMEQAKKRYKSYLIVFVLFSFTFNFMDKLFGSSYILQITGLGYNAKDLAIVMAVWGISLTIFDYPTGNLSDRIGRKKCGSLGILIFGLGLIILALSKLFITILGAFLFISLGVALYSGSPTSWFYDMMTKLNFQDEKKHIYSKVGAFSDLIGALGAIVIFFVKNPKNTLLIGGVIAIITSIFLYFFGEENFGEKRDKNFIKDIYITSKEFLKEVIYRKIIFINIINFVSFGAIILFWQLYYKEIGGKSENIGLILGACIGVMALGKFLFSKLVKIVSREKLYISSIILFLLGYVILLTNKSQTAFYISFFIIEIAISIRLGINFLFQMDNIPMEKRASYTSALSGISEFGITFVVYTEGVVIEKFGFKTLWIFVIISLLSLFLFKDLYKDKEKG